MTFSELAPFLAENFVCAWVNVDWSVPFVDTPDDVADLKGRISNSQASENVTTYFADSFGRVVHVLPGYWNPEWFRQEAEFVLSLRGRVPALEDHREHCIYHDADAQPAWCERFLHPLHASTLAQALDEGKRRYLSSGRVCIR